MVAVDWQARRNQPTFKPTKAAPANSSRVENAGRRATGGGGGCCWGEGRMWRGFTGVGGGGGFGGKRC